MLACPHPVRCRATAVAGDGGRVRRKSCSLLETGGKGLEAAMQGHHGRGERAERVLGPDFASPVGSTLNRLLRPCEIPSSLTKLNPPLSAEEQGCSKVLLPASTLRAGAAQEDNRPTAHDLWGLAPSTSRLFELPRTRCLAATQDWPR